ncbi:hypothetical protein ACWGLF_23850 [Streptomyces puniciscabiei]
MSASPVGAAGVPQAREGVAAGSGLTAGMIRANLPYLSGTGELHPPAECVPPEAAAPLQGHLDRIQARIDCLARYRDRLSACLAAVRPAAREG